MATQEGYRISKRKYRAATNRVAFLEIQLEQTRRNEEHAVEAYQDLRKITETGDESVVTQLEAHDAKYEVRSLSAEKAIAEGAADNIEAAAEASAEAAEAYPDQDMSPASRAMAKMVKLLKLAKQAGIDL